MSVVLWTAVAGWAAVLFIYSIVVDPPAIEPVVGLPQIDKVGHGLGYLVFGLLLALTLLRRQARAPQRWALVAGLLAVVYGALMEGLQGVVPIREMDLADLGADALGAFGGAFLGLRIQQASNPEEAAKVY